MLNFNHIKYAESKGSQTRLKSSMRKSKGHRKHLFRKNLPSRFQKPDFCPLLKKNKIRMVTSDKTFLWGLKKIRPKDMSSDSIKEEEES